MKKNVFLMSILFLGLFFTINQSKAQSCATPFESCLPDCPDDLFSAPIVIHLVISPGCEMWVTYSWRRACDEWDDYQIMGVELDPANTTCTFSSTDIDEVLDAATIALLGENPRKFPFTCGQTIWRATKALCWRQDGSCFTPCPPVQCNLEEYSVCNGVITQVGVTYTPTTCIHPCESLDQLSE